MPEIAGQRLAEQQGRAPVLPAAVRIEGGQTAGQSAAGGDREIGAGITIADMLGLEAEGGDGVEAERRLIFDRGRHDGAVVGAADVLLPRDADAEAVILVENAVLAEPGPGAKLDRRVDLAERPDARVFDAAGAIEADVGDRAEIERQRRIRLVRDDVDVERGAA